MMQGDYPLPQPLVSNDAFNILKDGSRAQNAENFLTNQDTYNMYFYRLLDLAMSVFKWKNLPDGVDERMLEYWLLTNGFCVFFYDEDLKKSPLAGNKAPEGYAVLQAMINGQWDIYNYPMERRAYAVNGMNIPLSEDNSVLIFNNYIRIPMLFTINQYARRLAECDRTIDVNVMAQKTPKIIRCSDKQRLSFKNIAMQVDGNMYWIYGDKSISTDDIEVLDISAPYVGNELQILKHQYWNEVLTYLGVENVNTEKKERLVSDEVMSNMGDVEAQRFTRLNARKQACKEINKIFGLEVDVEFRSGIYIKADGYGARQIATSGMRSGNLPAEEGTGYTDSNSGGIINKIKALLGM